VGKSLYLTRREEKFTADKIKKATSAKTAGKIKDTCL
jgi:hypothetical protein